MYGAFTRGEPLVPLAHRKALKRANRCDPASFIDAIQGIIVEDPDMTHEAPHSTSVRRPDEVGAARNPVFCHTACGPN